MEYQVTDFSEDHKVIDVGAYPTLDDAISAAQQYIKEYSSSSEPLEYTVSDTLIAIDAVGPEEHDHNPRVSDNECDIH